ncbi:DUF2085 domain-containing protein [Anaerotignum sp.]|uniref:DUF2085 domain-containing protein n=1 Tax=Anaerotignum sp. TaxID=2039241 RepID=UPI0027150017|nr:DUF2085 domain-containing protein [Anaerotignum sp.]
MWLGICITISHIIKSVMDIFDFIGSAVCHQMAERSFILDGMKLPVCARCTGIYSGIFFSMVFFFIFGRLKGNKPYSTWSMLLGACAFIPISVDGFFSYMGFWESTQFLRVVTGALAGSSLCGFFLLGANFNVIGENEQPIFQSTKEQLFIMGITLVWGLLLWMNIGEFIIASSVIVLGIVCFWTDFLYVILKNLLGNKKLPFWTLSFCGSLFIILTIGVLRQ